MEETSIQSQYTDTRPVTPYPSRITILYIVKVRTGLLRNVLVSVRRESWRHCFRCKNYTHTVSDPPETWGLKGELRNSSVDWIQSDTTLVMYVAKSVFDQSTLINDGFVLDRNMMKYTHYTSLVLKSFYRTPSVSRISQLSNSFRHLGITSFVPYSKSSTRLRASPSYTNENNYKNLK